MAEHGPAPDEQESFSHPLQLQGIKFQPGSPVTRQSEWQGCCAGIWGVGGRELLGTCSLVGPTHFPVCPEFAELYSWKLGRGDQLDPV